MNKTFSAQVWEGDYHNKSSNFTAVKGAALGGEPGFSHTFAFGQNCEIVMQCKSVKV